MKYPFEASITEIGSCLDRFVSAVFSCLESEFLTMPRGEGFIEYPVFESGYEVLKRVTKGFKEIDSEKIIEEAYQSPMIIIVIRTILGFTPSEWAYLTTQRSGIEVPQNYVRTLDRNIRIAPLKPLSKSNSLAVRLKAIIETACDLLNSSIPKVNENKLHRLEKADTYNSPFSINALSELGVPYAMLLYERFLGRPFAGHRDSVSELVGDSLESVIEEILNNAGISYRKTKRAERIAGFDQAPDFIIPSEYNPKIVIEAKITEDDGTARDKVTRIQHLTALSTADQEENIPKFEVVAVIAGRGFGVRREDMKKLILATRGKVFTIRTLDKIIEYTGLKEFKTK